MGRRELRDELQSTWTVIEPRTKGVPMTKKDIDDAALRERQERETQPDPGEVDS